MIIVIEARMSNPIELVVEPRVEALSARMAERIAAAARECVARKGAFSLVLTGGSTPAGVYQRLASAPCVEQVPWDKTFVYFTDERHVRPDHPDSNYRMA